MREFIRHRCTLRAILNPCADGRIGVLTGMKSSESKFCRWRKRLGSVTMLGKDCPGPAGLSTPQVS